MGMYIVSVDMFLHTDKNTTSLVGALTFIMVSRGTLNVYVF